MGRELVICLVERRNDIYPIQSWAASIYRNSGLARVPEPVSDDDDDAPESPPMSSKRASSSSSLEGGAPKRTRA